MANTSGRKLPLRSFAMGSYDPVTGRSHSSLNPAGQPGNYCTGGVDNQMPQDIGRNRPGRAPPSGGPGLPGQGTGGSDPGRSRLQASQGNVSASASKSRGT